QLSPAGLAQLGQTPPNVVVGDLSPPGVESEGQSAQARAQRHLPGPRHEGDEQGGRRDDEPEEGGERRVQAAAAGALPRGSVASTALATAGTKEGLSRRGSYGDKRRSFSRRQSSMNWRGVMSAKVLCAFIVKLSCSEAVFTFSAVLRRLTAC